MQVMALMERFAALGLPSEMVQACVNHAMKGRRVMVIIRDDEMGVFISNGNITN